MCGIVGFTGNRQAAPILLDGLEKLEYRGYDSAGIAVRDGDHPVEVVKAKGTAAGAGGEDQQRGISAWLLRHRSYPLGDARGALGDECPSPHHRGWKCGGRSQRNH